MGTRMPRIERINTDFFLKRKKEIQTHHKRIRVNPLNPWHPCSYLTSIRHLLPYPSEQYNYLNISNLLIFVFMYNNTK